MRFVGATLSILSLPSGKLISNRGKTPCFMGKSTNSMVIFKSYLSLPEGKSHEIPLNHNFPMVFPQFSHGEVTTVEQSFFDDVTGSFRTAGMVGFITLASRPVRQDINI